MEIFKSIIILDELFNIEQENIFIIKEKVILKDDVSLIYKGKTYLFDYLIFSTPDLIANFKETNILHEAKIPLTNFYFQTSVENIYYTKDIKSAIDNIYGNE